MYTETNNNNIQQYAYNAHNINMLMKSKVRQPTRRNVKTLRELTFTLQ